MLQFHLSRLFGTKFKTHGVAIANEEGLRLVFREGETPPKLFDQDLRSVLIHWANFRQLEVERGFFGTRLVIQVHSTDGLSDAPGLDENEVALRIHRSHVDQIPAFERRVAAYRSGKVDENVDEFVDDVRDFLRGHE